MLVYRNVVVPWLSYDGGGIEVEVVQREVWVGGSAVLLRLRLRLLRLLLLLLRLLGLHGRKLGLPDASAEALTNRKCSSYVAVKSC